MINLIVESKQEYTTQLVNILTPLIYEGIQTIYQTAIQESQDANNILKFFQSFLKRIPKWNPEMIKNEVDRIMNNSKSFTWLPDLLKATIKAHIVVLSFNPTVKNQQRIDPKFYQDIKIDDFIHRVYIECARELWNNPYLLYHQYPPIELKRNQRDTINLVKDAIKEAIRKSLPVKQILEVYLGEQLENDNNNDEFDKPLSEVDGRNIQKMIKKDLAGDNEFKPVSLENSNQNVLQGQSGGENNDINKKILEIIKTTSDQVNNHNGYVSPRPSTMADSDTPFSKMTKNLSDTSDSRETHQTAGSKVSKASNVDDKIRKVLEQDLGETDIETSLSYKPERNENDYQEIFANSAEIRQHNNIEQKAGNNNNTLTAREKDTVKNKRKFFNNYLNF
jgi:hypothetical protein